MSTILPKVPAVTSRSSYRPGLQEQRLDHQLLNRKFNYVRQHGQVVQGPQLRCGVRKQRSFHPTLREQCVASPKYLYPNSYKSSASLIDFEPNALKNLSLDSSRPLPAGVGFSSAGGRLVQVRQRSPRARPRSPRWYVVQLVQAAPFAVDSKKDLEIEHLVVLHHSVAVSLAEDGSQLGMNFVQKVLC